MIECNKLKKNLNVSLFSFKKGGEQMVAGPVTLQPLKNNLISFIEPDIEERCHKLSLFYLCLKSLSP